MSWSKRLFGHPEKVALAIMAEEEQSVPPPVKEACKAILGAVDQGNPVLLETTGHLGSYAESVTISLRTDVSSV